MVSRYIEDGWSDAAIDCFRKEPIDRDAFDSLIASLSPGPSQFQRDELEIAIGYACRRDRAMRESGLTAPQRISKKRSLDIVTKVFEELISYQQLLASIQEMLIGFVFEASIDN